MTKNKKDFNYSPNGWIVHKEYGIGKIEAIEDKFIGDSKTTYYRIDLEIDSSTVWVPVGEEDQLRPVTASKDFDQTLAVLQRPSHRMSSEFQSRLARISQAKAKGTPQALARVVRDLWARQKRRGKLSNTEQQIFQKMVDQLLAEWSHSIGLDKDQTRERLYAMLQQYALPAAWA